TELCARFTELLFRFLVSTDSSLRSGSAIRVFLGWFLTFCLHNQEYTLTTVSLSNLRLDDYLVNASVDGHTDCGRHDSVKAVLYENLYVAVLLFELMQFLYHFRDLHPSLLPVVCLLSWRAPLLWEDCSRSPCTLPSAHTVRS